MQQNNAVVRGQVLVIDENGQNRGTMDAYAARKYAEELGLDLVVVQSNEGKQVVRVMDRGKWEYEKKKKEKASRQHVVTTKEMRFSLNIAQHDIDIKVRHVKEFLTKGHPVRIFMKLKGRELAHMDDARNLISRVADSLKEISRVDKIHSVEKTVSALLIPN